ncbi:M20/M25/M40 family metallo-hydrolase [Nonomuraea sp. NPDC003707]
MTSEPSPAPPEPSPTSPGPPPAPPEPSSAPPLPSPARPGSSLVTAELRDLAIFRADLHAHPELSWQEARTAARLAGRLVAAGYEVTTGVGGHGVVGRLCRGDGITVMLRAELDALPVKEETGLSYASTATATTPDGGTVPVSHACGHDLHLACLAGAARRPAASDDWRGTVLVIGQPAEETLEGAAAMLADGLYERFGVPDVALAQYVSPFPAVRLPGTAHRGRRRTPRRRHRPRRHGLRGSPPLRRPFRLLVRRRGPTLWPGRTPAYRDFPPRSRAHVEGRGHRHANGCPGSPCEPVTVRPSIPISWARSSSRALMKTVSASWSGKACPLCRAALTCRRGLGTLELRARL